MSSRMRKPETSRLELTRGDWLIVKQYLTAGESREMFRRIIVDGEIDRVRIGWSKILAYLLDWSFTDSDDKPVAIVGKSAEDVGAVLDALDTASFTEVLSAIEAHEAAMEAALKNAPTGETSSSPISPSPASVTGDTNG